MPPASATFVVIDSNVLLDWLVFEDPSASPIAAALGAGELRWIATQPMLDELADVLQRASFERWQTRVATAMSRALQLCERVAHSPVPPAIQLHCTDPDDQKFIDLALTHPARWLLSRDKALLRLARRARPRGVEVLTPWAWAAARSTSTAPAP